MTGHTGTACNGRAARPTPYRSILALNFMASPHKQVAAVTSECQFPPFGSTVDLSYACSLTGPWSTPQAVYSIPQIGEFQNEIAYVPTFHPELTGQGGLVVSYNLNSLTAGATLQNVHLGQPQFLLLNN